jgi:hypothetical protein
VAPRGPAARRPAHGRLPGSAGLRRVLQAADDAGPRAVLQARDGPRRRRPHAGARSRALRGRRARSRPLRRPARHARPPGRRDRSRRARRRPDRGGPGALRRPVRAELVALVLPRADRQARRADHLGRPRRVVPPRPGAHGRGGLRRPAPRAARPEDGPRDVRGLPRRPRARPRGRRRRPGRGPADRVPGARPVVDRRRHGGPLRRVLGAWRPWADDLRGGPLPCGGHHLAEEVPEALARELLGFLPR